jgi:hypothetical protein
MIGAVPASAAVVQDEVDINSGRPVIFLGYLGDDHGGAPEVGEVYHSLSDGKWLSGTSLARQWTRNGKPIAGARGSSYTLMAADVGARIALSVTGTRPGSSPLTVSSTLGEEELVAVRRPQVVNSSAQTIGGTGLVGKPLIANPGTWTAGTRFTYQWRVQHNTKFSTGWTLPISRATSKRYVPTAADDGGIITVMVTGWKDGYDPLLVGRFGLRNPKVEVHKALVVTPVVEGNPIQGVTLTAKVWRSGATLAYQWKRNGVPITGATKASYTTRDGDAGKKITVTVTGALAGFPKASATSAQSEPVHQEPTQYENIPAFSWDGVNDLPVVGQTVRMTSRGTWTPGAKLSFQWMRDGKPIKGATHSSYKFVSADVRNRINVKVTGQAPNHTPATFEGAGKPVMAR